MAIEQLGPVYMTVWDTETVLLTGGANGTRIDHLIANNSFEGTTGAITTKMSLRLAPNGTLGGPENEILTEKSLFRRKNYELGEFEGFFLAAGVELRAIMVKSTISTSAANPSVVIAGTYEDL